MDLLTMPFKLVMLVAFVISAKSLEAMMRRK